MNFAMLSIYFYLIQDDYGSYIANISPDMNYPPDDMLKMLWMLISILVCWINYHLDTVLNETGECNLRVCCSPDFDLVNDLWAGGSQ